MYKIYETVKKVNFFNKATYKYYSALKSDYVIAPVDYLQKERCDRTFEENYLSEFIKDNIDGFIIKSSFHDGYIIENNARYVNDPANWTVNYSGKCFKFEVDF